jgi:hypothetical protein
LLNGDGGDRVSDPESARQKSREVEVVE